MKKELSLIICVLAFGTSVSFARVKPLANEDSRGLYVRSIEQVLRLEEDEIDLATAVLIISEQWNDNVYGRRYLTELDNMAFEIRDRLKAKRMWPNRKAIPVINEYLFDELRFKPVEKADNPNDLFLHSVLDEKRGYCLSLSILYLSLGERLGLPLYGVVVPEHFFVRYDDGRVSFNIETTSNGVSPDDQHYIDKFNTPEDDRDSIYMKKLNKLQTLGCFFNNLGNSYSEVGNIDQAMVALERAVEINPSLAESRMNLGNIYLKKDRVTDAIFEYRAALEINPNDDKMHNNLGNAYARRGWHNDAIGEYTQSLRLNPDYIDAYKNLAKTYCNQQMFAMAQSTLKEAIGLEPKNADLYHQLGEVYSDMGHYETAIVHYKKTLKIKRDYAEAYYGLGLCYNGLGNVEDEIRAYKRALSIKPDMAAVLMNLGNVYFREKKYKTAIEYYQKAVQIVPDESGVHYNIGAAYSNMSQFEEAVAEYEKAIVLEPKMGDAHHGLAVAFYNLEKYESAWKHIKTAEELGAEITEDLLKAIEKNL